MKRVFLYVRVSTEEQAIHGLSIEAQTAALEEWARSNGHKIVGTYVDAGISARKPASKRPELQRLLDDVTGGKGDLVVFTKLDRWFRNIAEYYKVQEVLEKHHVDWKTIHEDYDTSTASGRLKINIMLSVAQDEADRTSERIKAVFERKREKLEPVSGRLPLGYMISGKKIVKDPGTEEMVNDVFRKYMSCGSICETQRFILEKYNYRMLYQRISKILYNTAYYGKMQGAEGMSPAYITKEEFGKIQEMRARVARKTKQNRVYLFSGLVTCGACGRRMSVSPARGNASPVIKCNGHHVQKSGCTNGICISEKKIEAFLIDRIESEMNRLRVEQEKVIPLKEQKNHGREIAQLKEKISKLKNLYLNDLITLDEYKEDRDSMLERINSLAELDKAKRIPNFGKIEQMIPPGWKSMYQDISREKKRDFWRSVLKEIRIYPDRHIEFDLDV